MDLELCQVCKTARESGELRVALNCHSCKGTGIKRKPTTYVCNVCAQSLCPDNRGEPHGLVDCEVEGGYDSTALSDSTTYRFSICEACLRNLFGSFKIPPAVQGLGTSDYEEDYTYFMDSEWRRAGGHLQKLADGLCNEHKDCPHPAEFRVFNTGHLSDLALCKEHASTAYGIKAPVQALANLDKTDDPDKLIAEAYLAAVAYEGRGTYFRFMGDCLRKVTGVGVHDETSGIFFPHAVEVPPHLSDVCQGCVSFPKGLLFYGPEAALKGFYDDWRHGIAYCRYPYIGIVPPDDE